MKWCIGEKREYCIHLKYSGTCLSRPWIGNADTCVKPTPIHGPESHPIYPEEVGHGYVTNQLSVLIRVLKITRVLSIVGIGKKAQLQDQFSLGIYGQIFSKL